MEKILFRKLILDISLRALIITFTIGLIVWIIQAANYLDFVLTRLTVIGSIYLSFICLLPELLISKYKVPFYFGGTSLLIVVSVTMDTVNQIQSYLLAHQYEGLIRKSNLRRR